MRGKIHIKIQNSRQQRIKIRYLVVTLGMLAGGILRLMVGVINDAPVQAVGCPDLRVVFARGSGGEQWRDENYISYRDNIQTKLARTDLRYEIIDLDYPATGVGIDKLGVALGALIGAGEAYEFGRSVNAGVNNLVNMVNDASCPATKYVIGGYSQGAIVISKSLPRLNADRLIYAATFGDPKLYLPEGEGIIPAACRGENLSDYRMYVPDCQAYKGLLGAYIPYEPAWLAGKVGTWCNKRDIFCSSHLNISDHVGYVSDNLYEDAARVIYDKVMQTYHISGQVNSPHDTAILIDSTGSMQWMIDDYKAEALRLAQETIESGGRVALYDYRDLLDPYQPVKHCGFEDCTVEKFQAGLDEIQVDGGGDTPESLLSAAFHVMNELEWKLGSTKSLVALTDSNFLSPDRNGITFDQVVRLSKEIDPVNFYIITTPEQRTHYLELTQETDGRLVTDLNELSLLTDHIMERYDTLPRVEEQAETTPRPTLAVTNTKINENTVTINYTTNGARVLVALNDAVLGIVEVERGDEGESILNMTGIDFSLSNTLTLVPLSEDTKGEAVTVEIPATKNTKTVPAGYRALKAPNTGRR